MQIEGANHNPGSSVHFYLISRENNNNLFPKGKKRHVQTQQLHVHGKARTGGGEPRNDDRGRRWIVWISDYRLQRRYAKRRKEERERVMRV